MGIELKWFSVQGMSFYPYGAQMVHPNHASIPPTGTVPPSSSVLPSESQQINKWSGNYWIF